MDERINSAAVRLARTNASIVDLLPCKASRGPALHRGSLEGKIVSKEWRGSVDFRAPLRRKATIGSKSASMRVCRPEPPARTPLLPKGLDPVPANTKRIFYVKFLAHSVFADILAQRPDIRLD